MFPQGSNSWPSRGDVHLWFPPQSSNNVEKLLKCGFDDLSQDEQERYRNFQSDAAARRFLLGRVLLRHVLARYLGRPPGSLEFAAGPDGKPALIDPTSPDLSFNLTHDGSEAVLAVTVGAAIGIDMAALDRSDAVYSISRQYFSPAEQREIETAGEEGALIALKLWALKESVIKAVGGNVWQGLSGVSLSLAKDRIDWRSPPPEGTAADWALCAGYYRERYWLAVALKRAGWAGQEAAASLNILSRVIREDGDREEAYDFFLRSRNSQ